VNLLLLPSDLGQAPLNQKSIPRRQKLKLSLKRNLLFITVEFYRDGWNGNVMG
jgi:hypothetical protein